MLHIYWIHIYYCWFGGHLLYLTYDGSPKGGERKVTQPADASEEGRAEVESVDSPSSDSGFVSVESLIPPLIDSIPFLKSRKFWLAILSIRECWPSLLIPLWRIELGLLSQLPRGVCQMVANENITSATSLDKMSPNSVFRPRKASQSENTSCEMIHFLFIPGW